MVKVKVKVILRSSAPSAGIAEGVDLIECAIPCHDAQMMACSGLEPCECAIPSHDAQMMACTGFEPCECAIPCHDAQMMACTGLEPCSPDFSGCKGLPAETPSFQLNQWSN